MCGFRRCQPERVPGRRTSDGFASRRLSIAAITIAVGLASPSVFVAAVTAEHRVLPEGQTPPDSRLGELRSERGDFLFEPAQSAPSWEQRCQQVRQMMQVAMGLWPLPPRTALNAVIHGKIDQGDYTIEKVYFESLPGFYVTGNLYRPQETLGRRPAVLSPHGHFPGGRFQDEGDDEVQRKIASGAERFAEGGRSFMQSRCVQLARMGCVVFHYDMIGYGDSQQIPQDVAHRFAIARIRNQNATGNELYSAWALRNQHNSLGLHTWNSIRALDFLSGLADVDASRVAVTGGSGGGTQTFMLCALDDRPLVAVPVVIVSTTRQGGCTCENVSGLRWNTNNLEATALHAPKPLLLVSADDATRTLSQRGFPFLRRHYATLGRADAVEHEALLQFPHNYNQASRAAMYGWLNQHLQLGLREPIREQPYDRLTEEQLTVWDAEHPRPPSDSSFEQKLLRQISRHARRQLAEYLPRAADRSSLQLFRHIFGTAWRQLVGNPAAVSSIRFEPHQQFRHTQYHERRGLLRYTTPQQHQAALPTVLLEPIDPANQSVLWLGARGKDDLWEREGGGLRPEVLELLAEGITVASVDLIHQGEFLPRGVTRFQRGRWLTGEQGYAGWTYCYNLPVFAQRVQDIAGVGRFLASNHDAVHLLAEGESGRWAATTLATLPSLFEAAAVDTNGFRFAAVDDVYDADFLPGSERYGDLPAVLALSSARRLWIAGESHEELGLVRAAFAASGRSDRLTISPAVPDWSAAATRWILRESR